MPTCTSSTPAARAGAWKGIVKTGLVLHRPGVGVRAVSGEKTAFAYSDDISEASCWTLPARCGHFGCGPR